MLEIARRWKGAKFLFLYRTQFPVLLNDVALYRRGSRIANIAPGTAHDSMANLLSSPSNIG